jgi:hypothetical protein
LSGCKVKVFYQRPNLIRSLVQALLKSKSSADQYIQRILESTRGIVFMGTPHCGASLADWAVVGSKFLRYLRTTNRKTLEILQPESEVMARIRQEFHTMLRCRDQGKTTEIQIICFFEELPVEAVGMVLITEPELLGKVTGANALHIDRATNFCNSRQIQVHWRPRKSYGYDKVRQRSRSRLSERAFRATKIYSV